MPDDPAASDEERQQALADAVLEALAHGRRVEAIGPFMAVLVRGRHLNHLLHFLIASGLLSLAITAIAVAESTSAFKESPGSTAWLLLLIPAAWACVWAILRFVWGEKRELITVDEKCRTKWRQPTKLSDRHVLGTKDVRLSLESRTPPIRRG